MNNDKWDNFLKDFPELKGKGQEPTAFLDYDDGKPIAEIGWNLPEDARWFFKQDIIDNCVSRSEVEKLRDEIKKIIEEDMFHPNEIYELFDKLLKEVKP